MDWLEEFNAQLLLEDAPQYKGKRNVVQEKSFEFALGIIRFHKELQSFHEYEIGKQLLRSGTSIGANISEALAGQSRRDFISKMAIASKEARETQYWLRLILSSDVIPLYPQDLLDNCNELVRILTAIVKSAQSKR